MKIEVSGQTYIVRIQYRGPHTTLVELFYDGRAESDSKYSSSAGVRLRTGVGSALCSAKDNFCKATGRRIAFDRALLNHGFSKDECRQARKQFFAQVHYGKFVAPKEHGQDAP